MKRTLLFAAALATATTVAADAERGKTLHDEHCAKCHDSGVYTRGDRFVSDKEGLTKQVRRCELSLGLKWFDEDIADVVEYLNTSFYKFQ
jgi:cytochrome c2